MAMTFIPCKHFSGIAICGMAYSRKWISSHSVQQYRVTFQVVPWVSLTSKQWLDYSIWTVYENICFDRKEQPELHPVVYI